MNAQSRVPRELKRAATASDGCASTVVLHAFVVRTVLLYCESGALRASCTSRAGRRIRTCASHAHKKKSISVCGKGEISDGKALHCFHTDSAEMHAFVRRTVDA